MIPTQRDYYFDNAKFVLVLLVVVSHFISPLIGYKVVNTVFLTIYSFHMPAFVLISGYFAKKSVVNKDYHKNIIKRYLAPYIVFQVIYYIFYRFILNNPGMKISLFTPHFALWFLLSLFTWHVLLQYVTRLKHPVMYSLIFAIVAGYVRDISVYMSISRTICFFPFFLIGYYLEKEDFRKIVSKKVGFSVIFLGVVVGWYYLGLKINHQWMYFKGPYVELGSNHWYSGIFRLTIYLVMTVTTISFMSFIPERKTFMSNLSKNTMYIYLLHGFLFQFALSKNYFPLLSSVSKQILLIIFSLAFGFALSTSYVRSVTRFFVEPRLDWMFRKQDYATESGITASK